MSIISAGRIRRRLVFVCPICKTETEFDPWGWIDRKIDCDQCGTSTTVKIEACDRCRDYAEMEYFFENKGRTVRGYLKIPCETCAKRRYSESADINVLCQKCFEETPIHIDERPLNGIIRSQCNNCKTGFIIVLNPLLKSYNYTIAFDSGGYMSRESAQEVPTGEFLFVCPTCKKKSKVEITEETDVFTKLIGTERARKIEKPVVANTVLCESCSTLVTVSLNKCRFCNDGFEMSYTYGLRTDDGALGPVDTHEIPCSVCAEHLYNGPDEFFWLCGQCSSSHTKKFKKYPDNGIFVNKCSDCGEKTTLFLKPQNEGYTITYISRGKTGFWLQQHDSLKYGLER